MNYAEREDRLATWLNAEEAMRARLGPVGTVPPAAAMAMPPPALFDAIGRGELPRPPMGELMGFVPVEWAPGYFVFQGTPRGAPLQPVGQRAWRFCSDPAGFLHGLRGAQPAGGGARLHNHRSAHHLYPCAARRRRAGPCRGPGGACWPLDSGGRGASLRCGRPALCHWVDQLPDSHAERVRVRLQISCDRSFDTVADAPACLRPDSGYAAAARGKRPVL